MGLCKLKCTEKRFIPLTPLHFFPQLVPMQNLKEDLKGTVSRDFLFLVFFMNQGEKLIDEKNQKQKIS
jgi:hypothetical protein